MSALSGNAIPLQNVQDVPPLPPMLATIQTKTCLTIQHYVDEEEKGEKAEGGTREKEMEAATDANLFCELSFSSITCESSLINRIMAVQNDRTRTSFDISQHISGLSVWYNAEPNAIIFSFHLCALPSAGTLHCDYSGDGGVTVVSEFELVGQPRYAKYLASLGDGPLRLCDYVSQLRVFFQPGDPEEESSYGHKLLVSFDVNPAETVPDCDLLHEDLEDWEAQVQSGWFQFQCEDVLGPSSHSAAKLSPEDASARIPTYIKEGMPYQSEAQGIGISGPSHLLYERNNHLCVRDTAPTAEERAHLRPRLAKMIRRLTVYLLI
ncbi:hypothetical protein F5883DRAFT_529967 [Diaporthe sp. PMI_573]|nr:hypothetical protein F5883DRAFT_529967 [Diaporthaceae sp. PMI_573]